jgi:hypothetical protein
VRIFGDDGSSFFHRLFLGLPAGLLTAAARTIPRPPDFGPKNAPE